MKLSAMPMLFLMLPLVVVGWCQPVTAQQSPWQTNIEKALKQSAQQKKDLLLLFTGSDWCPSCQQLEKEVLGEADFLREIEQDFVLVRFEYPEKKQLQPDALARQNQQWAAKYGVEGYPTVILIDQQQRPYGITGYREGGVENYLGILSGFLQIRIRRDDGLTKAKELEGSKRATAIDEALSEIDPDLVSLYYEDLVAEMVAIDNEDRLGLRTKWNSTRDSELRKNVMTDIVVLSRLDKPEKAIAFIDEVMQEIRFPAQQLFQILQIKLNLLRESNQTAAMDQLLEQMIAMEELTDETRQRLIVRKSLMLAGTERRDEGIELLDEAIKDARESAARLWLAKGQLLAAADDHLAAIESFDAGIALIDPDPDVLVELHGARADSYMLLGNELRAMQTLDRFADDQEMPTDLRARSLLHKAMIMRESGRSRRATLVENRAINLSDSPSEQARVRSLVQRLRQKYGE